MSLTDRIEIRIEPEMHEQLKREAAKSDRSVGAVVRVALREHLERKKVRVRT